MSRLAVSLTFLIASCSSSIAFADIAPGPKPNPEPTPTPEPKPEPKPEVEAPAPAEPKADAKADAKAEDKAGKCSVTDQGDAMLGLAALCLLISGVALRRRA